MGFELNEMNWEPFTGTGEMKRQKLSIFKGGKLQISSGSVESYDLDEYEGLVLHYDETIRVIGIEPVHSKERDGFLDASVDTNGNIVVDGGDFFKHYGIPFNVTRHVDIIGMDTDNNLLIASVASLI